MRPIIRCSVRDPGLDRRGHVVVERGSPIGIGLGRSGVAGDVAHLQDEVAVLGREGSTSGIGAWYVGPGTSAP